MRLPFLIFLSLLLLSCDMTPSRSVKTEVDKGILYSVGVITDRIILDLNNLDASTANAESDTKAFGLEYLAADGGYKSSTAMRYDIKLLDGGELTIYSESWRYQVEDCVNLIIDIENPENPPELYLNKQDC